MTGILQFFLFLAAISTTGFIHAVNLWPPIKETFWLMPAPLEAVECDTSDLSAAITEANNVPTKTLTLASDCTYEITIPATLSEALPPITGNITIIGGKNTVIGRNPSADLFRIFTVNNGATLTLKNLTIKNGNTANLGGGILNNGTVSLESMIFMNNNAANGGGLSIATDSTANVVSSQFLANTTTSVGGGAILNFGAITVDKSRFRKNSAPINGGAINTQPGGTTTISSSEFLENTSAGLGGAFSNLGTLNIDHSLIRLNTGSSGGGIATGNANVNLSIVKIIDNIPDNCSPINTIDGCVDEPVQF